MSAIEGEFFRDWMRRAEETCPLRIAGATRFGHSTPRICTPPLRELTRETSLGYSLVEFVEQVTGASLIPWSRSLLSEPSSLRSQASV